MVIIKAIRIQICQHKSFTFQVHISGIQMVKFAIIVDLESTQSKIDNNGKFKPMVKLLCWHIWTLGEKARQESLRRMIAI